MYVNSNATVAGSGQLHMWVEVGHGMYKVYIFRKPGKDVCLLDLMHLHVVTLTA